MRFQRVLAKPYCSSGREREREGVRVRKEDGRHCRRSKGGTSAEGHWLGGSGHFGLPVSLPLLQKVGSSFLAPPLPPSVSVVVLFCSTGGASECLHSLPKKWLLTIRAYR